MAEANVKVQKRAVAAGAAGAVILGALAPIGWRFGLPVLTQVSTAYRAIAPSVAAGLVVPGVILLWSVLGRPGRRACMVLAGAAGLTSIYGLLDLIGFLVTADLNREDALTAQLARAWSVPFQPMSPVAATLMFLVGLAVAALLVGSRGKDASLWLGSLVGALGTVAAGVALVFLLSYLHGVPLLYGSRALPIAATSAMGFLLLGAAVVAAAGPEQWPLRPLAGESARARLLRAFVPLTVLTVLVTMVAPMRVPGLASVNGALQSSFLAVAFAFVAGVVASRVAVGVGGALDAAQAAQREAEEALRRSERRWATTLASVGDAVIATDVAGRVTFMNATAESATGWSCEEARGRPASDILRIINERTGQEVESPVERALKEGAAVGLTDHTRLVRRDGTEVPIHDSSAPIRDEAGRVTGVVLVFHDISERRLAEAARERLHGEMEQQRELLETVVENSRNQLVYLDREFNFIWVNDAYARACQRPRESFPGHNHFEFYPHEENEAIFRRVRETGEPVEFLAKPFVFPDHPEWGTTYWDWRLTPLKAKTGEVEGFVFSLADITETVRARERLLEAERARATLAEHLGDEIAHRVKNNLAMISGLLQMQMLGERNEDTAEALREAVGRLRTFVTLHEQIYAAHADEADLLEVLQQIGRGIADLFAGRDGVAISVRGEPMRCSARVATNLSVIANELITNALKHGGPGGNGRREILATLHRAGEDVALTVWNSGVPVAEDLDPARSRTMGLRLVYDIVVEQYEGRFSVRPSDGGTLAEVVVPGAAMRAESLPR